MGRAKSNKSNNSANIGFEAKLWLAADKLRSNMDTAEYKHVVPTRPPSRSQRRLRPRQFTLQRLRLVPLGPSVHLIGSNVIA